MRAFASPVLAVLALATAACASGGTSSSTAGAATATSAGANASSSAASMSTGRVVATIVGVNGGRLAGTLTLTPGRTANETRARVNLLNGPATQNIPWIIRQGQCGEPGPEVGPMAAYRRILTRADGSAETTVTLPIALPKSGAHHVRILSAGDGQTMLGCGMLSYEE